MPAVTLEKKSRRGSVIAFIAVFLYNLLRNGLYGMVSTPLAGHTEAAFQIMIYLMNLMLYTALISLGQAIFNENCENVHVVNELDVPVLCMGLKDVVVSASPEGILVSDKEQSSYIKPFVDQIDQQIEAFSQNAKLQVEKGNKAAGTRSPTAR